MRVCLRDEGETRGEGGRARYGGEQDMEDEREREREREREKERERVRKR